MAEFGAGTRGTPPGWYDDTTGRARWRYWDGSAWTPWVASADTAVPDPRGAPDATAPSPASHARGPHPANVEPTPVTPTSVGRDGAQPNPSAPGRGPLAGALLAIVGAFIAAIGYSLNTNAPAATGGEEFSADMILGALLMVLGLGLLGVGLLVLVVTVTAWILRSARRRR